MNIVIVKHDGSGNKLLFQVPGFAQLKAGENVRVRTKRGDAMATCLSDSFFVDDSSPEFDTVCAAFKATLPLAPVVGRYDYWPFYHYDTETATTTAATGTGSECP